MSSGEEQRTVVVRYWWNKAEASLLSAKRELEAEAYDFAVNRLYYALFYAVSATLMDRGLSFKKHSGVRAAFHRELVKSGLLDAKWGKVYDQLFEDRQEGDYLAMVTFDKQYVESQLTTAPNFLRNYDAYCLLDDFNQFS